MRIASHMLIAGATLALLGPASTAEAQTARGVTGPSNHAASKLSGPERRALDIDAVNVVATRFGLVVRITMSGDLTRRLGAGGLARAAAGIVLTRRGGGSLGFGKVGIASRVKEFATDRVPLIGTAATTRGNELTLFFGRYDALAVRKVTATTWRSLPGAVNARAAGDARVQVTPRVLAHAPLVDRAARTVIVPLPGAACAGVASQIRSGRDAQAAAKAELKRLDATPGRLDARGRRRQEDLLHEMADLDTFISAGDDFLMRHGC